MADKLATPPAEQAPPDPTTEIVHEGDTVLNTIVGVMGNVLEVCCRAGKDGFAYLYC